MPFDPNLPLENTLINAVPADPKGPQDDPGPEAPPFANAVVDGVNSVPPPSKVTPAALDAAIAGTAQNPSGIAPFRGSFSNPPT